MRAGALLTAIVGGWLCVGTSLCGAAPSAKIVTVGEVAASPARFDGERLRIKGVLTYGWEICSPPLKPDAGAREKFGAAHCIAVRQRSETDPLERQIEKYHGAEVVIDGIYWNRCLPGVSDAEPAYVRDLCDEVPNGYLGPIDIRVTGHVPLHEPSRPDDDPLVEIDLASPQAAGIDVFAKAFVAATQARDRDALLTLFDVRERGQRRVWLKVPTSRESWVYFAPEMRPHRDAGRPGTGYRYYIERHFSDAAGRPPGTLCFCRTANCERRWPRWQREISETQSIKASTICFRIWPVEGKWQLSD